MNKTLIATILAVTAGGVAHLQAQGTVQWGNAIGSTTSTAPAVRAQIYGVIPGAATTQLRGNSPQGFPAGTTQYGGAPLLEGTGFTLGLFSGATPTAAMAAGSATDMSVFRTGGNAGFAVGPRISAVANIPSGSAASVQLRAWDNRGGTVTSWAAVMADPSIAHGAGDPITLLQLGGPNPAGGPDIPAPQTVGFRSFNLVVPEPSLIALGALALGGLLLRRRK